ncbi:C2H2 finger domain protein [Stachybotrys elegans]|uniref:C2H2 finger domain protein n=1 Tax=Stachybotrys elegans TaxID=80388 RepID=A0A8K0WK39_9HYPO|nr:C2H2 finger domain protein [Stachybotrys elegans]
MYDSDASFLPSDDEEPFDSYLDQRDDLTSDSDLDSNDRDSDEFGSKLDQESFDFDNEVQLYAGNLHPPEYYIQGIQEPTKRSPYSRYAPLTQKRLIDVENQWKQFCTNVRLGDFREVFKNVSVAILEKFLEWCICQKVGKNGRKKPGIQTAGALNTRWKNLQIVYKVSVGRKFTAAIYDGMKEVLQYLIVKYNLRTNRRRNRFITVETLRDQIETLLSTTKKLFPLGELRILTALFLLLLAPGGSRPMCILLLRFQDIKVILARDPEGGPNNLLIRFTPEFTKTWLGAKETTTFTVPEGIFHRSLLLSPQVFLLAILFRHKAFEASSLTSPECISKLTIHPGENELPIPLKASMDDTYIFRRTILTLTGYEISPKEPISYNAMAAWIKGVGRILGIEDNVICYSLRYFTGNKLDQSSNVSDSLRNLCLGHAESMTFQRNYLSREICADTFAVVLGEAQQQALITQSCSIAHSISKRRPIHLTQAQKEAVKNDPRMKAMKQKIRNMPPSKERMQALRDLRNAKQRKKHALLEETRKNWTAKQAVDDIERQLRGEEFTAKSVEESSSPMHPAQESMVVALRAPAETTIEDQNKRKNKAIQALVAYCSVEEGRTPNCNSTVVIKRTDVQKTSPSPSALDDAVLSVFVSRPDERPTRCFLCIGKALCLSQHNAMIRDLINPFHSSSDLSKHFRRKHLLNLRPEDRIHCQVCDFTLQHKMHLQRHAKEIHGTIS